MSEEKQEQQEPEVVGPGALLKQARLKAGLSTAEIADKLHLKVCSIEDLESDIYDESISMTFTKGYLKLYAKQVHLPEAVVLEAFEKLNTKGKEPAKLQSFSRRVARQASDDRLMLVTYLIVFAVIALVVIWWWQQSGSEKTLNVSNLIDPQRTEQASEAAAVSAPEQGTSTQALGDADGSGLQQITAEEIAEAPISNSNGGEVQGADQLQSSLSVPNQAEAAQLEPIQAEPIQAEPIQAEPIQSETTPNQALEQSAESLQQALTEQTPNSSDDAQPSDNASEASGAEVVSSFVAADPVELVFQFSGDCWMNLVDATGEAIAYGVKVSGRVMPVSGIPPFEVTLGAPEAVQISYDGVAIDMSQFRAGRTARFTLPLSQ